MAPLATRDFFHPSRDADCSYDVIKIYRMQFLDLYRATDRGEIKTSDGRALRLAGDTLITYKCAVRNIYGKYFTHLDSATQLEIRAVLKTHSHTSQKQINCWNNEAQALINNHQIGNMMPFPSAQPSMNSLRASAPMFDYFDTFLAEVKSFYILSRTYQPTTALQRAIEFQRGYFEFFKTYDNFIETNLLQDFINVDLRSIRNFSEYVRIAGEVIDRRGKRFTAPIA